MAKPSAALAPLPLVVAMHSAWPTAVGEASRRRRQAPLPALARRLDDAAAHAPALRPLPTEAK